MKSKYDNKRPIVSIAERFWPKVIKSDNCWNWTASLNPNGYGQIKADYPSRSPLLASRVSWVLANGTIPAGLCVLHKCDNPKCVRPDHLFLGTPKDNVIDMMRKGRHNPWGRSVTHCQRGHEYTPENTYKYNGSRGCKACRKSNTKKSLKRRGLA